MDHLPQIIASACPDSKIASKLKIKRKKATQLIKILIGPSNKDELILDLKENYFSIILDETTDISTSKCLAVIARYYKNNKILDRFFILVEIENSTANGLFQAIKGMLTKYNIPFKHVIGFGADTCSVMMGNKNGLKVLFEDLNPNIITNGCTCHSFHLCSSYACEKLPRSIEQFSRDIYNYFSNSSKRCMELKECEVFANERPHAMLCPSQTRWLSLQSVINRILEHWASLELFFTRAAIEDNISSAQNILSALHNPVYKLYFYFLSYVLDIMNRLNLEFQSEIPKVHVLLKRVTTLYKLILKSFIKGPYLQVIDIGKVTITDPEKYLSLENIYCGPKADIFIKQSNMDSADVKNFHLRVLEFYVELCKQIKKRFNFGEAILKFASYFDPTVIFSSEITSISEADNIFPFLNIDLQELDLEYRILGETEELKKYAVDGDVTEFWANVECMKNSLNEKIFPNIMVVAKCIMSLPHSSAAAKRIFSQLNLIKTKTRNKLLVPTCESLLHAKDMLRVQNKKCYEWVPTSKITTYNKTFIDETAVFEDDILFETKT
ncbi:hypothetical protein NQ314_007131 [Rhamnusium bicolor]|uniref:HAT C-terminal dimerisation domain-containing protein n=1 Tax=Rhamnusium bicolor TaxID=1586634 RepID=A0AAV8YTJ0_9CUCU|nr:hypothetical protein NQ314_007131 [Rhamnusium bicolor]